MSQTPEADVRVSAVVVVVNTGDRTALVDALRARGVAVDMADEFHRGRQLLATAQPDLLVTDLRLGAYNGLHLVLRGKAERPRLQALVLARSADPVLQREAVQLGATLLVINDADGDWLAPVLSSLAPLLPTGRALAGKPLEGA